MKIDDDLNILIALQCAPVLENIKIANLLTVRSEYEEEINKIFLHKNLATFRMGRTEDRTVFFIYRCDVLSEYVFRRVNYEYLSLFGYGGLDIEQMLELCSNRYGNYIRKVSDFPHEIGLFLGYPLDDVRSFVDNRGDNAVMTGYWKVYHNVNEAKRCFCRYNQAIEHIVEQVKRGCKIKDLDIT